MFVCVRRDGGKETSLASVYWVNNVMEGWEMVLTWDYRSRGICCSVNTPACSALKVTGVDGESEIQSSTSASENHHRCVLLWSEGSGKV